MSDAFANAMTACAVAYGISLAPERIEVYEQLLGAYGEDALVNAIRVYLTLPTSRFFPVPADLVGVLVGEVGSDEGAGEVTFGRIWRVAGDCHAITQITDADPAAKAAFDAIGGWRGFTYSDEPMQYQRRTFARAYAVAAKRLRLGLNTDGTPRIVAGDSEDRPLIGPGQKGD